MISGHGNSTPDAFFIADAASSEDLTNGYALSGYSGKLLGEFCRNAGLSSSKFYHTCLIKEALPAATIHKKGKEADAAQALNQAAARQFLPILVEEINNLSPYLLIPLGELSFNLLTGVNGIRKFRGSVMLAEGSIGLQNPTKVLPILGPYPYLFQEYRLRYITRIDFDKIRPQLNRNVDLLKPNVWVCRSSSALRTFLERSYSEDRILVFDIETFMGMPTCISFCFDGVESVCIPFMDQSIDIDHRVLMIDLVARILASPIKKVNQNIKYDWKRLEAWGFYVNNVVGDTMLAASTLYCEFPKNLGFLTSIYTDLPYFKDEGREFDPDKHKKEQFYLYNAKDSLATHQIYHKQVPEISEQGVAFVYESLIKLIPIYRRMEDRGIRINLDIRSDLSAKYYNLFEIETMKLRYLCKNEGLNPLSSKQMNVLVFDTLKFKKIRGVKGTEEESLELLMAFGESTHEYAKDILQVIINCRKLHKVIEVLELQLWPDNRFRCEFNLSGTETGRSSAGKTTDKMIWIEDNKIKVTGPKDGMGHSLQTIGKHGFMIDGVTYGKDIRNMFIPSNGFIFVECDLSQAEARVDTILAGNFDLLTVFDGPVGIHRLTGSWVYGCPPDEIKKNTLVEGTDRYHMAKTVRHAVERNMREDRMMSMTQCTFKEAARVLKVVHEYQPEIRNTFHRDIKLAITKDRVLKAPNGRRRDFFDRIDNHTINEGISTLPQAIVSDQTKFSLIPTSQRAPWAEFLVEQHDGVLAEVPIDKHEEYIKIYREGIETEIDFTKCSLSRNFKLTIPMEASTGYSWGELVDYKES